MHKCKKKKKTLLHIKKDSQEHIRNTCTACFFFRWRDLAETPVEPVALDNQSLGSGAEGPEEPDKPEDHFHHFCKFVVSATPLDK